MSAVAAPQVLRYWLALLRHEEALAVRPRARKVNHALELTAEQMLTPSAGQDYVKLPFSQQGNFLVDAQGSLEVPVEAECAAFFEAWLASQYRYGAEDGRLEHLVCFPALLLPRQELAGLVRFPVHIDWRTVDGKRFTPPSASDRAKKQLPPPPRILSLRATKQDPDSLPFFIDGSLLRETLRVDFERIEAFFSAVKRESPDARQLLRRLCDLLRDQMASDDDLAPAPPLASGGELASSSAPRDVEANDLLAELFILTDKRLTQCGAKGKAYEIAILLDASRNRASFHVQRDLQAALEQFQSGEMKSDGPLSCYLGQRKAISSVRPLLGRFGDLGLTQSQRRAGERYLGSALCAVQGPPGTGKTHLILNLAAQQLIDNVTSLIKSEHPGQKLLIVTSTNNRAVDNVVFPLGRDLPGDVLPFALRVGSRDVVEKVTVVELQRAQRWLERRTVASDDEWEAAKNHLARLLAELEGEIEPSYSTQRARIALQQGARELLELEAELAVLDRTPLSDAAAVACGIDLVHVASAASELRPLLLAFVERLLVLSSLSEAEKKTPLVLIEQSYKLTLQRQGEPMEQLLGSALSWGLPPRFPSRAKADDKREAWEEGAEAALHQARALLELVEELAKRAAVRSRANELRDQLASRAKSVRGDDSVEQDFEQLEPRLHELWTAACRVRELWARRNKGELGAALQQAIDTCRASRSLRPLMNGNRGPAAWLMRLYPVWGCTLLSLGNHFSPEADQLDRVVIDEAGQCHAAYAVSALLRARSALVIGDTHQLEPIVELSAQDESRVLRSLKLGSSTRALEPFRMYEGCGNSAQSVADRAVLERPTLTDHFRCQPEIAAVCEQLCAYGLTTHTPASSCEGLLSELTFPLLHVPVDGQQTRFAGSWLNLAEVEEVQHWVVRLLNAGLAPSDVGVITPFRGQLEMLWRQLRSARIPLERAANGDDSEQATLFEGTDSGVALGTVHRFQGGERRVIVFSTTITQPSSLRFIDDRVNLINVAASRAREHLLTVGHRETLLAGQRTRLLLDGESLRSLSAV